MSDIQNRNAEATKQGLEELESRIRDLETKFITVTNQYQTIINQMTALQQANTIALQRLRGGGPTSGN